VAAFEALENLPALAHTRDRLMLLLDDPHASSQDVVLTIESDVALAIAVLRAGDPEGSARRANVADSVAHMGAGLRPLVERMPTFDFFERSNALTLELGRLRLHALATQTATQRICNELQQPVSAQASVAALLHDIGKVVLDQAAGQYQELLRAPVTPEQRVRVEQQAFGIDHAAAGAAALRRLHLPVELTVAVENHHSPHAQGDAALVRVADMLAHYEALGRIDSGELARTAALIGLDAIALRRLLYNSPRLAAAGRPHLDPCPLSRRQLDVLRLLRDGMRYKEIAAALGLSDSTVRSHTNVAYRRLGVTDRAQAVLRATDRGWI
jgi:putative nucleotidyltransferase with HDIG domain